MSPLGVLAIVIFIFVMGVAAFLFYRRILRRAKSVERGLKMVPIRIYLPAIETNATSENPDQREAMRRKLAQAETLYSLIAGSTQKGFKSDFYGQRHVSFEIVATDGKIHFYAAVPVALVPVIKQALLSAYPSAQLEEVEDYNPFSEPGKLPGTVGGELILKDSYIHPLQTFHELETDPLEALVNTLSTLQPGEGAAIQVLVRPAGKKWVAKANRFVRQRRRNPGAATDLSFTGRDLARAAIKSPQQRLKEHPQTLTGIEEAKLAAIEEKAKHPGFESLIRLVVSTGQHERSQAVLTQLATTFSLLEAPGRNGLKLIGASNVEGLVTAFIFRFFPPELSGTILNSVELATIFHLPEARLTATAQVERQHFHEVDGPVNLPTTGLLLGYNVFRGVRKEVRLDQIDRRRHTYIVGQTGTGKSTLMENLAVQDMNAGAGFAFIDPHGDAAERILSMVPKERAEDVVYFNPGDTARPLGLNLFEFHSPEQKDFIIQESIGMLYKLYDPGHTGIIGPRYEHWFRNAALTLMSDPEGATFIEIPKVFTDNEYLKQKFRYVRDQTVIDFWTKEMAQTSDYHKSEMLGWFVSKFGAFMSNEIMRNIIGQPKSAFDLRDIMDNKKILIVNLSKGLIGELNSQLLGMILVIKFQAAAMSRANVPEAERNDFCLYVDEFQNFSTDSFATILSEARKYRLSLTVANQFIGQLSEDVRNAVFGNVGTIASFRTGPEDADFLVKQFAPVFDTHDLVNIPNGHAVVRLMVGGLPSQPFSINALPPVESTNPEMGEAVKQLSAAKFGLVKENVEAEINARLGARSSAAVELAPQTAAPEPASAEPPAQTASAPVAEPASAPQSAAQSDEADDTLSIRPQAPVPAPQTAVPATAPAQPPIEPTPAPASPAPTPVTPEPVAPPPNLVPAAPVANDTPLAPVDPETVTSPPPGNPEPTPAIAEPVTPPLPPEPTPAAAQSHPAAPIVSRTPPVPRAESPVQPQQQAAATETRPPEPPRPPQRTEEPRIQVNERPQSDGRTPRPDNRSRPDQSRSDNRPRPEQRPSNNQPRIQERRNRRIERPNSRPPVHNQPRSPHRDRVIQPPNPFVQPAPPSQATPISAPPPQPKLVEASVSSNNTSFKHEAAVVTTTAQPTPVAPATPKLQPGEVHVDEHGNVHRGQ